MTWGCFLKNSLFNSLFSNESCVFCHRFLSFFEKVSFMVLYSSKIGVWDGSQTMWDSCSCMRTHGLSARTHTHVCMCTLRVSYGISFPKLVLFLLKISYIFHKYFFKSIFIRLGYKITLDLGVLSSLENGGPSHKWYKMRCLQLILRVFDTIIK